ncbi:uncharacterized protein PAC_07224 [Phialocephala subalpina]|uniref:Carboxymuconolactone decarboxylase-like domain-containing protein n=1 Tax=Phialocephala subalpina TaxID=576137 RepID=A0A1L7WX37_9HELO|nr:uncharacterized protein PAC_07224 [Phialocephala subalpina]
MRSIQEDQVLSADDAFKLFQDIEKRFPGKTLGDDKWYLVAVGKPPEAESRNVLTISFQLAALVGSTEPEQVASLYTYLISKPEFTTSESRQQLVRRMREALVKCVSIVGVCKPLEAIFAIAKLEKPEDMDYSFSRYIMSCSTTMIDDKELTINRQNWESGAANHERGVGWFRTIYRDSHANIEHALRAHKDFFWLSEEITYGLYLSDHTILGPIETELVVLAGIMIQNLPLETAWHLRGARRVGMCSEDVEVIQQCIELVANFSKLSLYKVPRVADIEHEV